MVMIVSNDDKRSYNELPFNEILYGKQSGVIFLLRSFSYGFLFPVCFQFDYFGLCLVVHLGFISS